MKAAELFVRCLENEGVQFIFGIPGEENLDVMEALVGSPIRFITTRHEQAAAFILVHNHPSGDPTPSAEDREVTSRLVRAGEILGVRVVDHVVVAERGFCSLREEGAL